MVHCRTYLCAAVAAAALFAAGCRNGAHAEPQAPARAEAPPAAPVHGFEVVRTYPHDAAAFTQGLIYRDGVLYESTGLNGRSSVRRVRLETGEVLDRRDVDAAYFAEGMTDWQDRLIQLTWTTGVGFVYDLATFEPRRSFSYQGEGWGLTQDGRRLIMSDGTSSLRFLDPDTLEETGRIVVRDAGMEVGLLNELEFVRGEIYANVWTTNRIAIISPETGVVTGWINLDGLYRPVGGEDVLNGIAYDAEGDRLFVTGKLWRSLFEIRIRRNGA